MLLSFLLIPKAFLIPATHAWDLPRLRSKLDIPTVCFSWLTTSFTALTTSSRHPSVDQVKWINKISDSQISLYLSISAKEESFLATYSKFRWKQHNPLSHTIFDHILIVPRCSSPSWSIHLFSFVLQHMISRHTILNQPISGISSRNLLEIKFRDHSARH